MKIIHFGDLHVWKPRIVLREWYAPKRWLGPLNLVLRRARQFPPANRKAAMDAILAQEADAVLFSGDFSNFSLEEEFREAARLFAPLREKWGDRLVAIPGNHDVYTPRSVRLRLLERHLPWVHTETAWQIELAPGRQLIGVHHAVPLRVRSNGLVTDHTQTALLAELKDVTARGNPFLVMGHFPYATPQDHPETEEHRLIGEERLAELLAEYPPAAYLHGHKHVRWAIRPQSTPQSLCLNCGSASMAHADPVKKAGFLSFDWEKSGTVRNITAHTLHPDSGAWIPSPLSETASD